MTDQGEVIPGGVSEEVWKRLNEEWGMTATNFRELYFIRDYHGSYKHYERSENGVFVNNKKINISQPQNTNKKISLLQIRYGSIPEEYDGQPCLWYLLRHEPESGQISTQAQLQISLHILETTENGESAWVEIGKRNPNDHVNKATQHGQDVYVLKFFIPASGRKLNQNFKGPVEVTHC